MHKIDSNGATIDDRFTEGDASMAIPATIVSAAIMNSLQEELVNLIEGVGITLLTSGTDTEDQLNAAVKELIARGGRTAPVSQSIVNNQTSFIDVTDFPTMDISTLKSVVCVYDIFRITDTNKIKETGYLFLNYDSDAAAWDVSFVSGFDDAGVTFSVVLDAGSVYKLQYKSTNLAGGSYVGTARLTDIKKVLL